MSLLKSATSLKPLFDRVLVQKLKPASKTASGIYIPENNQEKSNQAIVIAVGPGVHNNKGELVAPSVKAGDNVLVSPFGGSNIKIGDDDYVLFSDKEILAKIEQ